MCLNNIKNLPYNLSNIRWKIARRNTHGTLQSPYQYTHYHLKSFNTARLTNRDSSEAGFHVLLTRKDARTHIKKFTSQFISYVILKIQVKGFLHAGQWSIYCGRSIRGIRSETWKKFRILAVS